jgi:hypothetical protein
LFWALSLSQVVSGLSLSQVVSGLSLSPVVSCLSLSPVVSGFIFIIGERPFNLKGGGMVMVFF